MQRLSQDLSTLESHYDVIVVGSGYGGSIAACRLARTGASVALFERGRELHPGEYPSTKDEAAHEIQASLPGTSDSTENGLYRFHVGKDMSVFSGCGLGGTSLVNANVSLEPDERVLDDPRWPAALRSDAEGMQAAFGRARTMLGPTTYPDSYPALPKMAALKVAAGTDPWYPTPINVTFRAGPTAAGVHQEACTNCGDCVTGCNHGAKNTVLMNYLPDAVSHGARIFCELDVRWIEKGEGTGPWVVHVQPIGEGRDRFDAPPLVITADVVVLAAGTLGTTGILLRSAEQGLSLSRQLGKHFTGNGDVLGFAYLPKTDVHGTGAGDRRPEAEDSSGPCITSVIDRRPGRAVEDGIVIEDAVIPGAIANLLPIELATQIAPDWLRGRLPGSGPLSWLTSLVTGGRKGLTRHLQTFLVMGNDDDEGMLVLDGDRVRIEWPGIGTTPFYEQANQSLRTAAANGGGQFLENPLWSAMLGHSLVTVHPLGGCVMADSADRGVVDHRGAVFAGADGTEVHEGLYAWDGSIVPRPLGVNPLLTISALTERAAALLAAERQWTIDPTPATDRQDDALGPEGPPPRPGLRFTEEMDGFWTLASDDAPAGGTDPTGDLTPYLDGFDTGKEAGDGSALSFVLTLSTDDIAAEIDHTDRPMTAVGTLQIPALSGDPLEVADGWFQLLVADDSADSDLRHMWYRLPAVASDGSRYHFEGFKVVTPGNVTDVWPDTTTLYVTLRRGSPDGPVLGRGVLRIEAADFARQLSTVAVTGRVSARERIELEARFAKAFAGALAEDYGHVVHRPSQFRPDAPPRRHRPLDVPTPRVFGYRTADGVDLHLTRYPGGERGPVVLSHGMGNSRNYTLDTMSPTLLEYLVHRNFDVWVQEWRASTLLPSATSQFTGEDIVRFDHPGALAVVRAETGRHDVHVVGHCVGALTWTMASLAGTVDPASLLCSSVSAHPIAPTITRAKVGLHLGELMHRGGVRFLTTDSTRTESWRAKLFDQALRLYPVESAEDCDEAVCRRLAFIYGDAAHHPNLNEATHMALHELWGVTNLTMMDHLSECARRERAVAADGADAYLPHLERLQFPITFLSGSRNLVWLPESTKRTYDLLVGEFGTADYELVQIPDYGHQDVFQGADAAQDTFPAFLAHLDRVGA